jgi:ABC-type phosphate/phosphonate transport system permease subunit
MEVCKDKMKIDLAPGKFKILKGTMLLIAVVMLTYVGYAALTLSVSNTGSIVTTGKNWQGATFQPGTTPTCATAVYSDTPTVITWSVPAGSSQTATVCVKNISTAAQTFTATTTALIGSITVAYSDATNPTPSASITSASIASGLTDQVTVTVSASSTATGALSFTSTFQ